MKGPRTIDMVLAVVALILFACSPKGPAEKAGQRLDRGFQSEGKGPFQRSGEELDKAGRNVSPPEH